MEYKEIEVNESHWLKIIYALLAEVNASLKKWLPVFISAKKQGWIKVAKRIDHGYRDELFLLFDSVHFHPFCQTSIPPENVKSLFPGFRQKRCYIIWKTLLTIFCNQLNSNIFLYLIISFQTTYWHSIVNGTFFIYKAIFKVICFYSSPFTGNKNRIIKVRSFKIIRYTFFKENFIRLVL